jgi:hypothetical protein
LSALFVEKRLLDSMTVNVMKACTRERRSLSARANLKQAGSGVVVDALPVPTLSVVTLGPKLAEFASNPS